MARIILVVLFAAALIAGAIMVMQALQGAAPRGTGGGPAGREVTMRRQIAPFAYVLLILLMFGVTTGLIA